MPSPTPSLTRRRVLDHIDEHVFGTAADPHGLGVELEWLTSQGHRDRRLPIAEASALIDRLSPLPDGGRLTLEPGGQLELSSQPFRSIDALCAATRRDLAVLDAECEACEIELIALGADPVRPPERVAVAPRYQAMERYFDQHGRAGRTMMCNTAAIQVNIGLGGPASAARRWRLANRLGPTLIASFANSPFGGGLPSGWQSSRLRAWWALDPTRSAPVRCDDDPVTAWADYALDAHVMLIRADGDRFLPVTVPMRFGDWMADGHPSGWPTDDDLAYHLTTLFPPVRPKGWLELRMFDAQTSPLWQVVVAVTASLLTDPALEDALLDAVDGTADLWVDAAQLGLGHPELARAARRVFALARESLAASGASLGLRDLVCEFAARGVDRSRSPADDRLAAWRDRGELFPPPESPKLAFATAPGGGTEPDLVWPS
jgi:glutamate--cysteine ligase